MCWRKAWRQVVFLQARVDARDAEVSVNSCVLASPQLDARRVVHDCAHCGDRAIEVRIHLAAASTPCAVVVDVEWHHVAVFVHRNVRLSAVVPLAHVDGPSPWTGHIEQEVGSGTSGGILMMPIVGTREICVRLVCHILQVAE